MSKLDDYRGKHEGRDIVVLGTGPSLHSLDKKLLEGKVVICVNSSILKYREPDYYFSSDGGVCQHSHWKYVREGKFPIILGSEGCGSHVQKYGNMPPDREACYYAKKKIVPPVMRKDAQAIIFGASSVHCAVHFAVICGAKRIIVIGCDCVYVGNICHFYDYEGEEKSIWLGEDWPYRNVRKGKPVGSYSGGFTRVKRMGNTDGCLGNILTYWRAMKKANPNIDIRAIGGLLETVFPKYTGD